jgi:hypothetical protein
VHEWVVQKGGAKGRLETTLQKSMSEEHLADVRGLNATQRFKLKNQGSISGQRARLSHDTQTSW